MKLRIARGYSFDNPFSATELRVKNWPIELEKRGHWLTLYNQRDTLNIFFSMGYRDDADIPCVLYTQYQYTLLRWAVV